MIRRDRAARYLTGIVLATVMVATGCSSSGSGPEPSPTPPDASVASGFTAPPDTFGSTGAEPAGGTTPDGGANGFSQVDGSAGSDGSAFDAPAPVPEPTVASGAVSVTPTACALGVPGSEGQVTFIRGAQLLAIDGALSDPDERCLADLPPALSGAAATVTRWSPPGTQTLLGGGSVLTSSGRVRPSGFLATNPDVEWSYPTGKRLLAATAKNGLVKREVANGTRTDISYLAQHTDAAYHPAGKFVVSVGTDADGQEGIFAASNNGGDFVPLVSNETAERVWSPQFTGDGTQMLFLAKHTETVDGVTVPTFHVHHFDIVESDLSVPFESGEPLDHLSVSPFADRFAVQVGGCEPGNRLQIVSLSDEEREEVAGSPNGSLTPVGWLPGGGLVVASSDPGVPCGTGGPVSLAVWADGALTPLVDDVYAPSVRAIRPLAADIPLGIGPGAT